ncbi:polycystin-1-like isoform X1, partial [Brachionus plicatilis]
WIISDLDNREKWVILNISNYASFGKADTLYRTNIGHLKLDIISKKKISIGMKNFSKFSNELTIFKDLFLENLNDIFRIEFTVKTISISNGISLGSASLFLSVNKPPKNGSCGISPLSGFSGSTIFTIECQDWYDSDGFVERYEFYINFLNNHKNLTLGFSEIGFFETVLPDGPSFDQNKINVFAKVIDNLNSHSIYSLGPVTVSLNKSDSMRLIEEIEQDNEESVIKQLLHESNSVHTLRNLIAFVFSLNELSHIDKKSLIESKNNTNLFLTTFGPKTNISFESNFEDINTIMANFLVSETINITSKDYETKRNIRASIREKLVNFISNISLLDVASVKFKSDLLSEITADSSEVTRETSIQAIQQILSILDTINLIEEGIYEQDMVDIVNNLANTMANILQGLSTMINERQPSLHLDYIRANIPPSDYDTDLENFWSNPNNFMNDDQTEISDQIIAENKNILIQKLQIGEAILAEKKIIDTLAINLAEYSSLGNPIQISTTSIQMSVNRIRASDLDVFLFEGLGKIELPSFCDLVGYNQTTISNFSNYFDWNDLNNCTNELLTVQIISKASAPSGFNSDNETKIGLSNSLSLKFFNSKKIEIPIRNSIKPIHLFIPRDPSVSFPEFYFVNTSEFDNSSQFLANQFILSTSNASLHINLKPLDNFTGYLMTIKFGSMPVIKENLTNLDKWEIFCPNEEQFSSNGTFLFFMNKTEVNGFKGFVGVGIRELNTDEFDQYCISKIKSKNQMPDYVPNITFTNDFYLRFYSSGCYYLDDKTGWWTSHGIEVMPDTNEKYTHCMTKHLTEFAGGLVILPTEINFKYVFANASLAKNLVIYSTVIVLTCVYFLFVIWGRYQDTLDSNKIGVCLLKDNQPLDSYFYEVTVFSGSRTNAETDSRVTIILSGDCDDTKPRILEDPKRKCFRRGGVDSFILSTYQKN